MAADAIKLQRSLRSKKAQKPDLDEEVHEISECMLRTSKPKVGNRSTIILLRWLAIVILVSSFLMACTAKDLPQEVLAPLPPASNHPVSATSAKNAYKQLDERWFQTTRDLEYSTLNFGKAVIIRGFKSDGSSSPFGNVEGTRYAGFLHDALYHGSPFLRFPDGFLGPWTKEQADEEYCHQLRKLKVSELRYRTNCNSIKRFSENLPAWKNNHEKRQRYWRSQLIPTD